MARELRWWLVGPLVACAVIVAAYLPPRGVTPQRKTRLGPPEPTAARLRARRLADEWRSADLALRLAQYRQQLEPELARRRETDEPGAALLIDAPDTLPPSVRALVRSALDTVWRDLGLGAGKVAVGVVVDFWRTGKTTNGEAPRTPRNGGYLFPDSTDRGTCVAVISAWTRPWDASSAVLRSADVEDRLRSGLGACAFFAAYGAPGEPVRRWLAQRNYDLAGFPSWSSESPRQNILVSALRPGSERWWWPYVYSLPVPTIGCLAGRTTSCRTAVLAGAVGAADDSLPLLSQSDIMFWRAQRLVQGSRYLGDVAHDVGRDRFLAFWNSTEPVDTALALALQAPIGEWTERWQRRFVPWVRLGPTAPFSATALGMVLAGLAVVGVAARATRREVG